jgi:hypothetical protein
MAQGLVLAQGAGVVTGTTETANQVKATYDYIGAGKLLLYVYPLANTCRVNLFVNGVQILRNEQIAWFGTSGSMDTSAHLVTAVNTLGGRIELTFVDTTGASTVDFLLTHDGVPFGKGISKLFGR